MLNDDGDLVRAVGYVAIYSVYLEESVMEIAKIVDQCSSFETKIEQFRLADQAQYIRKSLKKCYMKIPDYPAKKSEEKRVLKALKEIEKIAFERNECLHSIYTSKAGEIIQKNTRQNSSYNITSADIYSLANDIFSLHQIVYGLSFPIEKLKQRLLEMNKM